MRAYRELFAVAEVRSLAAVAVFTRIAAPMLSLSLVLAVVAVTGSYASAGLVLTGYAAALAVFVPIAGRMVDRLRARTVLLVWLAGNMAAYLAVIVGLTRDVPTGILVLCAIALGATTPPAGPVVRAAWPAVVPAERLQTAYALDAVLNESLFVSGPLLVSALLLFASPTAIVAVVAVSTLVGILLLVSTPSVRRREPEDKTKPRNYLGPLEYGQVRLLLAIIACDTFAFGSLLVGVPATAADLGSAKVAGVLLSVGSLGAVISGLVYGTRPRSKVPGRQLALFHAAGALLLVLTGQLSLLAVVGLVIFAIGLVGGPRDTLHQLVLGDAAPRRYRVEAFAWLGTFMWAGYALGTAATGQLVDRADGDAGLAFIAAGCAAGLAALLSLLIRPTEPAAEEPTAEEPSGATRPAAHADEAAAAAEEPTGAAQPTGAAEPAGEPTAEARGS